MNDDRCQMTNFITDLKYIFNKFNDNVFRKRVKYIR